MTVRQQKVQEQLIHTVSDMIQRDIKDPRLGFVTVTGAWVSRDLRSARVYVSVLGDDDARQASLAVLTRVSGHIRGEFARRTHLRAAPDLRFEIDTSAEYGEQIEDLLRRDEADLRATVHHPEEATGE